MKTKIILAVSVVILASIFISCDWFKSKPVQKEFNIAGHWLVDSIRSDGKDTSHFADIMAIAIASKDSTLALQFNSDSSFQYIIGKDSTKGTYRFSSDRNSMFLTADSLTHQFNFLTKSDSAITLATTDSLVYYMRRK